MFTFTWKLITNPNTRTPYGSDYALVSEAKAPDANTFIVTYDDNYAPALRYMGIIGNTTEAHT